MSLTTPVDALLDRANNLPTLPGIALRLLEAFQTDEPDTNEISDILSADPVLTSKILKIVNSSFYSRPIKIVSVKHGINLMGLKAVQNLVLSFSLVNKFRAGKTAEFDYVGFWKDSLIGAISAKYLAEKIAGDLSEDAFLLGLLQDIGVLTVGSCFPEKYQQILGKTGNGQFSPIEAETMVLGMNHMEIGEYLIKSWGLPENFYRPIGYHHCPEKVPTDQYDVNILSKILHLSSVYVEFFNNDKSMSVLEIINIWMTQYGFCDVDGLKTIEDINEQAQVIFPLFEFDFKTEADYIEFLEKARAKQADLSYEMINNTIMQKHDIEVLRKEVGQDSMTHLYNHERFWELLKHEIGRAERYDTDLSVIMCDIDDFKAINDSFGHVAGDRVIKVIANRLKVLLRGSDLIARYGGEEFAFILPHTSSQRAYDIAERLRKKIAAFKLKVGKQIITLTMSIGIASRQKNDRISVDDFIRLADDALYKAKSEGKNRCKVA
jgi:diguanylate cyclase (GGDEF)-like protein